MYVIETRELSRQDWQKRMKGIQHAACMENIKRKQVELLGGFGLTKSCNCHKACILARKRHISRFFFDIYADFFNAIYWPTHSNWEAYDFFKKKYMSTPCAIMKRRRWFCQRLEFLAWCLIAGSFASWWKIYMQNYTPPPGAHTDTSFLKKNHCIAPCLLDK